MIAQLSKRIASFFVHSRVIESKNEQVYEYGLELLISTLLNGVIALVLPYSAGLCGSPYVFWLFLFFLENPQGAFMPKHTWAAAPF